MTYEKYERIKEGVRNSYDIAAVDYHALFSDELKGHDYDRLLLDRFSQGFSEDSVICDAGCGPSAQIGGYLYKKGFDVRGLDFSESCINNAKSVYPGMKFYLSDMTKTNLPGNIFDGIVSFYALFHIPKEYQNEVFREFHRLLKPGGRLLLVNHKGRLKKTIAKIWRHDNLRLFINFSNEKEIRALLTGSGFRIDSLETKAAYYAFPRERVIVFAAKPG